MTPYFVSVWVDDGAEPFIRYVRFCRGKPSVVHTRLTNYAMKKFPNWRRVEIETQNT